MLQGAIFRACPTPKGALFVRIELKVSWTLKWNPTWLLYLVIVDAAFASWHEGLIFITFQNLILWTQSFFRVWNCKKIWAEHPGLW